MFKIFSRSQPIIPILYVDAHLNQLNAANLLKKLRKLKYNNVEGIAIVCSVTNSMPVQVDKIYQQISRIRNKYKIPIYSFLTGDCSAESYYIATCADHIYTLPSTVFHLHNSQTLPFCNNILTHHNIKPIVVKSSDQLNGNTLDQFTSANTKHLVNNKQQNDNENINKRIYMEAIKGRLQRVRKMQEKMVYEEIKTRIPRDIPELMIGKEAIQVGLVDQIGEYYQIIQQRFPESRFEVVKYVNQPKMKWSILIALLVIKGTIKWSLIMYIWLKSKENKQNNINSNKNISIQ